jgi:hypothetical protein
MRFVLVRGGIHAERCWSRRIPFLSGPQKLAELLVHATTTKPVGPLDPN